MKPEDFKFLCDLVKERSGLTLTEDKGYLLESRLMPLARRHELGGLEGLANELRTKRDEKLIVEVTEAMTTNESFFFRDKKPFDLFRDKVLPEFLKNRAAKKEFRLWCAAASSGQEPYSLAMIMKEAAARLSGWKIGIVGTDISNDILEKARNGVYSQFEVQRGLPIQLLMKHFVKHEDMWQIKPDLRSMIEYKYFNLLESLAPLGSFDVVFCRNVLIYFDQETKGKVMAQIASLMPSDGLLFLGGAETVLGITDKFQPIKGFRGVYGLTGGSVNFGG